MKKLIKIISILCLFSIVFTVSGCSLSLQKGDVKYKIENGEATVREYSNKSYIKEAIIPDEYEGNPVTKIADFGVVNLENVEKVVIGKNVKEIGTWAFTNNAKLASFEVDDANPYFCDVDGVLFTKDMKTLLYFPMNKDVKTKTKTDDTGKTVEEKYSEYVIPDTVETIRSKAFYKCSYLSKITIPDSVQRIEEKAFFKVSNIEELKLSNNIKFIGKDAFTQCNKVEKLFIPASIEQIDDFAFYNCNKLLDVQIDKKEADIKLGKKWYPTNNGKNISELKLNWK